MRVTVEKLKRLGACREGLRAFARLFPNGATINEANAERFLSSRSGALISTVCLRKLLPPGRSKGAFLERAEERWTKDTRGIWPEGWRRAVVTTFVEMWREHRRGKRGGK